ncbi:PAS domain-containing protein, partial [Streptomyces nigra]
MDSTPPPSSASPFDMVSGALGEYIPRGDADDDTEDNRDIDESAASRGEEKRRRGAGRPEQILGAVNVDRDLRITDSNLEAPVFAGVDPVPGMPFVDLLPPWDVPTVTRRLRQVLETGEPHVARVQRLRRRDGSELVVSMSILSAAGPREGLTISLIAMGAPTPTCPCCCSRTSRCSWTGRRPPVSTSSCP